jgi:hypothetical protein
VLNGKPANVVSRLNRSAIRAANELRLEMMLDDPAVVDVIRLGEATRALRDVH